MTYGQLIGGKLFHVTMPADYDLQQADGIFTNLGTVCRRLRPRRTSASTRWWGRARHGSISPGSSPARRPTSRTSASPECCTAGSCARGAAGRTDGRADRLGRHELGRAYPRVRVLATGRLHRCRRGEGVRRNPGGGAAEGEMGRPARRRFPEAATSSKAFRASTRPARRCAYRQPQRRAGPRRCRRRDGLGRACGPGTYGWPTNVHTPIGPQCSIADVTPQGCASSPARRALHDPQDTLR